MLLSFGLGLSLRDGSTQLVVVRVFALASELANSQLELAARYIGFSGGQLIVVAIRALTSFRASSFNESFAQLFGGRFRGRLSRASGLPSTGSGGAGSALLSFTLFAIAFAFARAFVLAFVFPLLPLPLPRPLPLRFPLAAASLSSL